MQNAECDVFLDGVFSVCMSGPRAAEGAEKLLGRLAFALCDVWRCRQKRERSGTRRERGRNINYIVGASHLLAFSLVKAAPRQMTADRGLAIGGGNGGAHDEGRDE